MYWCNKIIIILIITIHDIDELQVPTATTYVEGNTALNKCLWHQSGHSIAAADDIGRIHLYDLGEVLHLKLLQLLTCRQFGQIFV